MEHTKFSTRDIQEWYQIFRKVRLIPYFIFIFTSIFGVKQI